MFLTKKIASIILGSTLLAIGINFFLVPFELLDGGMIGVGLIIKYITGVKAGFAIICLSIPIFVLAWIYNKEYFYNSLHGLLFSAFTIDVISQFHHQFMTNIIMPPLTSSILGGIFIGLGMGIMLRWKTSTGGTDLIAQFLSEILKINVGIIIFIFDAIIICLGGLLISRETFLLSIITIILVGVFTSICTWKMND